MSKFVQYQKLGKKQKRSKNKRERKIWEINPVERVVQSKKIYKRKKKHEKDIDCNGVFDDGEDLFF